jgi:hypothetical protein
MKEKVSCQGLSQLTDFAPLAPALARFGRVGREATNQKVGSSNPPRAHHIFQWLNDLEE